MFTPSGDVLISRVFRPDVKYVERTPIFARDGCILTRLSAYLLRRSISEIFRIHVCANPDVRSPIITLGSTSFFHVRHANLYIACVTKTNVNAALVFEFCYRFIGIGRSYFGKLDEEAVKNNFVLIYELLDGRYPSQHLG